MSAPHADGVVYTTLVAAPTLLAHLEDETWVVIDARFDLAAPESGRQAYAQAHIPGAVYAHLDEDLSSPISAGSGRHPLPDPAGLARKLGAWGVGEDTQIVAYDDGSGAYAARLWWLARWLGHEAVAVLDGGLRAWRVLELPLSAAPPPLRPRLFTPRRQPQLALTVQELMAQRDEVLLVDARAAPRFRGEIEPLDTRAGHVPGAVNHPMQSNLAADGRFLGAAELRAQYETLLAGRDPAELVCMCGSGVTACHNLLALAHAGLRGARLYPGSWSEWIRDPTRPVATGPA